MTVVVEVIRKKEGVSNLTQIAAVSVGRELGDVQSSKLYRVRELAEDLLRGIIRVLTKCWSYRNVAEP